MPPNHILLVDDDPLLRRSVAFSLERAGYRVITAANAEEALAIADRNPPDLVLLDIGLPGIDGLGQRSDTSGSWPYAPPIIFLTTCRRELEQVLGLELVATITSPSHSIKTCSGAHQGSPSACPAAIGAASRTASLYIGD